MPGTAEARSLYRSLMRESHRFSSYNMRQYVARRTRERFAEAKGLDPAAAEACLKQGKEELDLVRRQATVQSLYKQISSVIEVKK
eukprot:CAMPEP_0197848452 /NCGR_PEP_ID=MMETSP1438-20131217/8782_1 /TAXON_ID=1461541 /ORGANISM="Pterosperma sp., Strain CCMP1384" /LENGTH=84 /DNA_ID=CAMNT_0043460709 /DNA_START=137 /DNA_END=391 /DNA_ORIENTATION=+